MKNKKVIVIKEYPDSEKIGSEYFFKDVFWVNENGSKFNVLKEGVPEKYPELFKFENI